MMYKATAIDIHCEGCQKYLASWIKKSLAASQLWPASNMYNTLLLMVFP